jgi:hypothetical protein
MPKQLSNRAKCDYWLDRAKQPNPGPCDARMVAEGQEYLFGDKARLAKWPLFPPQAQPESTDPAQPVGAGK